MREYGLLEVKYQTTVNMGLLSPWARHCFFFLFYFELITSIGIVEPLHCRVTRTIPSCLVSLTLKA